VSPRARRAAANARRGAPPSIRRVYLRHPHLASHELQAARDARSGHRPRGHYVRGHWKHQWHPSIDEHRLLWVDGYLRGDFSAGVVPGPRSWWRTQRPARRPTPLIAPDHWPGPATGQARGARSIGHRRGPCPSQPEFAAGGAVDLGRYAAAGPERPRHVDAGLPLHSFTSRAHRRGRPGSVCNAARRKHVVSPTVSLPDTSPARHTSVPLACLADWFSRPDLEPMSCHR
jgi:hypothetical protein